ncbi:lysophospholipid acyltransferase family protein [Piscibacillus halophilus]|uniref:lysophospholipid acyltransferase family protein n=1 Tax=Piscibacillus halophilus TaxID=571933 RepID=UPI003CCCBAB1
MARLFIFLKFRVEIIGKENIPTHGNYIVASNHCTVYDPILIGCIIKRRVHFLAKIELFRNRFFEWFFAKLYAIPVNRRGMVIRPVRRVLKILDEGEVFGIFPEGKRCKDGENIQPKKRRSILCIENKHSHCTHFHHIWRKTLSYSCQNYRWFTN